MSSHLVGYQLSLFPKLYYCKEVKESGHRCGKIMENVNEIEVASR